LAKNEEGKGQSHPNGNVKIRRALAIRSVPSQSRGNYQLQFTLMAAANAATLLHQDVPSRAMWQLICISKLQNGRVRGQSVSQNRTDCNNYKDFRGELGTGKKGLGCLNGNLLGRPCSLHS